MEKITNETIESLWKDVQKAKDNRCQEALDSANSALYHAYIFEKLRRNGFLKD